MNRDTKYKTCTEYWLDPKSLEFRGEFEEMYRDLEDPWSCEQKSTSLNKRLFLELLQEFSPYESILDIGCGLGGFTNEVKKHFVSAKVYGVDISETAVNKASYRFPEITFTRCNIAEEPPPFVCGGYHLVITSEILWYILEDLKMVFQKIEQLLEQNGLLAAIQYFPHGQRFGNAIVHGVDGFEHFVSGNTPFRELAKVLSHNEDGIVLMAVYRLGR